MRIFVNKFANTQEKKKSSYIVQKLQNTDVHVKVRTAEGKKKRWGLATDDKAHRVKRM